MPIRPIKGSGEAVCGSCPLADFWSLAGAALDCEALALLFDWSTVVEGVVACELFWSVVEVVFCTGAAWSVVLVVLLVELGCALWSVVLLVEVELLLLELVVASLCAVASGSVLGGCAVGAALLGVLGVGWVVEELGVAEFMLLFVVSAGGVVVEVPVWPALWSVVLDGVMLELGAVELFEVPVVSVEFVVDAGWADWSVVDVVGVACCDWSVLLLVVVVAAGVFWFVFAGGVDCPWAVVWADATPSANASTVKGSNKRFILFSTPDRKCGECFPDFDGFPKGDVVRLSNSGVGSRVFPSKPTLEKIVKQRCWLVARTSAT
jgi:hypothetical protein